MNYRECVARLEALGVFPNKAPTLEPMRRALQALGYGREWGADPERVISIAGTNGKGSTAAMLESLFIGAGHRVGLYTSPHLIDTTERMRVDRLDITQSEFVEVHAFLVARLPFDLTLSHFDCLTLMAITWFSHPDFRPAPLDWILLEVGLGGTWDSTNAIPHRKAIVTKLAFDHENLLGHTLPEIARNKFGVVSAGARVVHLPLPESTRADAQAVARANGSEWWEARVFPHRVEAGPRFLLESAWGETELPLPGARAAENASLALEAFHHFTGQPPVLASLSKTRWPGRMERFTRANVPVYLSGDHNPSGVASLIELLVHYRWKKLRIVVGLGKDKRCNESLAPLFALPRAEVVLTETPFKGRQLGTGDYGQWESHAWAREAEPMKALALACEGMGSDDLVLVTGSLYLVGAVRAGLSERSPLDGPR